MKNSLSHAGQRNAVPPYYIDEKEGVTYILHSVQPKTVTFFNPANFSFYVITGKQWAQMLEDKTLQQARYLLSYTFSPIEPDRPSTQLSMASNDLPSLQSRLQQICQCNIDKHGLSNIEGMVFHAVSLKDLSTDEILFEAKSIEQLRRLTSIYNHNPGVPDFQPEPVSISDTINKQKTSVVEPDAHRPAHKIGK